MSKDNEKYEAPVVRELGTVEEMTEAFDKVGSATDIFTGAIPALNGDIVFD
jgi:hypothetical protein